MNARVNAILFLILLSFFLFANLACDRKLQSSVENERQEKEYLIDKTASQKMIISSESVSNVIDCSDNSNVEKGVSSELSTKNEGDENSNNDFNLFDPINIEEATLFVDIFEVNGGAYSNKVLIFNGVPVGLLPYNAPPLKSWQNVAIKLSDEAIKSMVITNTIGMIDNTGDAYNLQNFNLKIKIKNVNELMILSDSNAFCSVSDWWSLKKGNYFKKDGSPFAKLIKNE
jgi:hypothetical protein